MALEDGGYIFGGNTGLSYEQLKQRRAIATALASRSKGFPKTKGEGMTYLGEALGEGLSDLGLQMREAQYRKRLQGDAAKITPATTTPQTTTPPVKTTETTPPVVPVKETQVDTSPSAMYGHDPDVPPMAAAPALAPAPVATGETQIDTSPSAMLGFNPDVAPAPPAMAAAPPPPVPPVSIDPNVAAPLTGGTATSSDLMAPNVSAQRDSIAQAMLPSQQFINARNPTEADAAIAQSPMGQLNKPAMPQQNAMAMQVEEPQAQLPPQGTVEQTSPDQVTLPTQTADIPLPRGNPRTTSGVRATMEAALSRGGQSPAAIAGIQRNVADESGFDYTLRHPDQPKFSGEARYAHGLYQEGGDEWNNYVAWIDKNAPGSDWRDPNLQSRFLAERLQDPQYARTNAEMNRPDTSPSGAAISFLQGYLKPAAQYMAQRTEKYAGEGGERNYANKAITPGGDGGSQTPGARTGAGGSREGGSPEDDTRDLVTAALLDQQKPQQPQQDTSQEERLQDVVGMTNRTTLPQRPTASLGRAGVASDTSLPSLAPMGALTGAPGPAAAPPAPPAQDPREAITQALLSQQGPGAMDQGAGPGAIASPTAAAAQPPPDQATTLTDIQPAPMGAPGQQFAQAAPQYAMPPGPPLTTGSQPTPQQFDRPPSEPPPPQFTTPTKTEMDAHTFKRMHIDDPSAVKYADDIIAREQAQRAQQDAIIKSKWERDDALFKEQYGKWQDYKRAQDQREQEYKQKQQDIIQQQPAPGAGGAPGTPQSPQRSGVPTVPPPPPGITPSKWAELQAPLQASAIEAVQKASPQFDDAIKVIQQARVHQGREYGLGAVGVVARNVPQTDAYAFGKINDQMVGKTFLTAYNTLKGGGQISNVEGDKAQVAQARIDPKQSPQEYDAALNDLEHQLRRDMEIAQRKVNMPVTAWRGPGDNSSYAPDIGERKGNHEYVGGNPRDPASWRKIQ